MLWNVRREDLELIQREISQLTERYSVKCLENAALSERLDAQSKTIRSSRLHMHNLLSRWAARLLDYSYHGLFVP